MDAEKKRHKCTACGRDYSTPAYLENHIRLAHSEPTSPTEKEPAPMTETQATYETLSAITSPPAAPAAPASPHSPLTPDERALVDQITRSKADWSAITEESMLDFSLSEDPLKLPPEAKARQDRKEFAYRWCERTPKRVAELTNAAAPLKWWVANSTTAPYLQKYVDPTVGGILRLDQLLLLKPWNLHQKVKDAVNEAAKALYNSRELDKGGAQKIQSRDDRGHLKVVAGDRAKIQHGDAVFEGEADAVGDLVAAD
jgi:hypothetical protein